MCTPCQPEHSSETAALWETFHEEIRGFIVKQVPTQADAEDILQDIFLRIHLGESNLQSVKNKKAWVFTITRRAIADYYRVQNKKHDEAGEVLNDTFWVQESLPVKLEKYEGAHDVHEEVLSWLRPMINRLPEKYRIALQLADIERLRQQDVATQLGLSLSGAKSRVQRARKLLGEMLKECCDVEFGLDARAIAYRKRIS